MESRAEVERTGVAVGLLLTGVAVVGAQSLLLSPLLSDVAVALDTGPASIGRASAAYGVAAAVAAVGLGRRLDPLPRGLVLRTSAGVLALALVLCAGAPSVQVLAVGQALAGAAAGVLLPVTYALAGELAPPGEETRVVGRVLVGWSVAMVAAVPLAAVLADLAGWRAPFLVLAAVAAALAVLYGALPTGRHGSTRPGSWRSALAQPGVRPLLLVVLAYMAAFYGSYAYLGDHVRAVQGTGASTAGLVSLAYGAGFGVAGLLDGWVDRTGPARLLLPTVLVLVGVYAVLPAAAGLPWALLALCLLWGVVNHSGLGMLVGLLSRHGGTARGMVMALYSSATYLAAALATAALGPVYEGLGFPAVAAAVVVGLLVATFPARRIRAQPAGA
ncbi:MAG: hypothetical protein AVDCRST_MAG07-2525 [uncultured Frankineae bacterium]|uniref:Major facilitator superfamily (MFS) profile domain-containing protein n=1 Tax=uncultured Frankineae bacterium TaxID=437475 RepID=A0A6J4LMQ4_9ACTN|nr:MAG: hypothetical protein AVDCRST_MAG07-2525 [uncultured Frankineae bacterium]